VTDRHPGDLLAALVDGLLSGPARERVLVHLAGCRACRADYQQQVAVKGLLSELGPPAAPVDLGARLTELAAVVPAGPPGRRPLLSRLHGPQTPRGRVALAGAGIASLSLLGLGTAYAAGGAPDGPAVVPAVDLLTREHAATTVGIPMAEPALAPLVFGDGSVAQPMRLGGAP